MSEDQLSKYKLNNNGVSCDMSKFKNLRKSGLYKTPTVNDKEFFNEISTAFEKLNFNETEIDSIY